MSLCLRTVAGVSITLNSEDSKDLNASRTSLVGVGYAGAQTVQLFVGVGGQPVEVKVCVYVLEQAFVWGTTIATSSKAILTNIS